jgi:DNA-binding PadR family transcriptional regulator
MPVERQELQRVAAVVLLSVTKMPAWKPRSAPVQSLRARVLTLGIILSILLRMSVRHALLALLSEGPKYGLQLRQEFEARTGEVWPLNVGQVYTTLQRLERDGLVESDGSDGPQNVFSITPEGSDELTAWLRTPPQVTPPPRDELVMKVLVAIRVPGVDVTELLQVHRRRLVEAMQSYTHVKGEMSPDDVELGLVVDAELFRIEAAVRWLDAAEARLRQLPVPVAPATPATRMRTRLGARR